MKCRKCGVSMKLIRSKSNSKEYKKYRSRMNHLRHKCPKCGQIEKRSVK